MTAPTTCFACKAPVLSVAVTHARSSEVLLVDPEPDHAGDVQIRHHRWGWDGRTTTPDSPQWLGWTKAKRHTCEKPMEASA